MTSETAPARVRRERGAEESLLSIALGTEAVLLFFVALTMFGLKALPAPVALIGGAVGILVLLVATRIVRWPWGVAVGWVLQALLLATGIVLPVMWGLGALFVGIWIYCFLTGRRLDRRTAAALTTTGAVPIYSDPRTTPHPGTTPRKDAP